MLRVTGVLNLIDERKTSKMPMRKFGSERSDSTLISIFYRYREFNTSRPHDHIFAIANLPSLDKKLALHIPRSPYERPEWELLSAVTKAIIYGTLDLTIICLSWKDSPRLDGNWPSWVPNFGGKTKK